MKTIECMDCGHVMNAPLRGVRKRCIPCAEIAKRTLYDGLLHPNKSQLIRRSKQKEDDTAAKRGHLEVFMGLDYADQLV